MLLDDFTIGEDTTLPDLIGRIDAYFDRPRSADTGAIVMGTHAHSLFDLTTINCDAGWLTVSRNDSLAPWLVEIRNL